MSYNPYDNVLATVENAAHILGYKPAEYEAVKYPERELSVSVPVRMDDGSVKVFKGYRVQPAPPLLPTLESSSRAFS